MNTILCGFQGVGKTYFGKRLSERLQRPFFDVDAELLKKNKASCISILHRELGELEFRRQEADIVIELVTTNNQSVIALGGGSLTSTLCHEQVKKSGTLIYLYRDEKKLQSELAAKPLPSYLQNAEEAFRALYQVRHNTFSTLADVVIDVDSHTEDELLSKLCVYSMLTVLS